MMTVNPTRTSLLDQLRESVSEDAWFEFSKIYGDMIGNWLRKQNVCQQDIDDVRQEVMATVCKEIHLFRHNGRTGAFRTWLRRITANRLHRLWEKRKRNGIPQVNLCISEIANQLADDNARLSLHFDQQHDACLIQHLLRKMDGRFGANTMIAFRRIVLLQHRSRDVAADLGMSLGAVRVAQHRVLRSLRELGKDLFDEQVA